jgi:hypothetical protein
LNIWQRKFARLRTATQIIAELKPTFRTMKLQFSWGPGSALFKRIPSDPPPAIAGVAFATLLMVLAPL